MRYLFSIATLLSIATCFGQTTPFADVSATSNHYASTTALYNLGITAGCSASPLEFCPTNPILRREAAIFLVRAWSIALYGGPDAFITANPPSGTAQFTDEPTTDTTYYPYVQKLWELGITAGCGPSTFCPTDNLENYQMAIFTARTRYVIDNACASACSPNDDGFTYTTTPAYFTDVPSTDTYFKWIQRVADLGIVSNAIDTPGCSPVGYFCESADIERGDAADYVYWGGLTGAITTYRGGSDFNWYAFDPTNGCSPYNAIANYDIDSANVDSALATMAANGQQALRMIVYSISGGSGEMCTGSLGSRGTDLSTPLSSQCYSNIQGVLNSVAAHGFKSVEISMGPQGANSPHTWPSGWSGSPTYEPLYQDNKLLLYQVRDMAISAGLNYKLDLYNEGIPPSPLSAYPGWTQYSQRLWSDYIGDNGNSDTMGFSFGPGAEVNMPTIYGTTFPPVFDVHFYGNEYTDYLSVWSHLSSIGATQGWVIGEVYYDDQQTAWNLADARAQVGNTVFWLAQWPWQRGMTPSSCTVAPPTDFGNYIAYHW